MTNAKFSLRRGLAVFLALLFLISASPAQDRFEQDIEQLKHPNPVFRRNAIERLGKTDTQPARDAVLSMLDDPGEGVRYSAIRAVGFYKDSRAVEALLGFLDESDGLMNQNVVWALGEIGDPRAFEPLLRLLDTGNLSFKATVAFALSGLKDERAFEPVYNLLMKNDGSGTFTDSIIRLGTLAVEPLCRKVKESNDPNRYFVVALLGAVADERAIPTLVWLLETHPATTDTDSLARRIGTPAAAALLPLLKSKNPTARQSALSALGQIKDEQTVESLLPMLADKSQEVRLKAIEVLADFGGGRIDELLTAALGNPDLRFEAVLVWGRKRDARALPYLIEALRASDLGKANEASSALYLLGKPAVEALIEILLDKNKEYPAREILYWQEEAKREQELRKQYPLAFMRCGNDSLYPPIIDPRRRAAILLGRIGDERAVEPLKKALADQSAGLREDAAAALKLLGLAPPDEQ